MGPKINVSAIHMATSGPVVTVVWGSGLRGRQSLRPRAYRALALGCSGGLSFGDSTKRRSGSEHGTWQLRKQSPSLKPSLGKGIFCLAKTDMVRGWPKVSTGARSAYTLFNLKPEELSTSLWMLWAKVQVELRRLPTLGILSPFEAFPGLPGMSKGLPLWLM